MLIESVRIERFRCLTQLDLPLAPQLNIVTGDNGSGKTSLIEALYFLGRGQSFRAGGPKRLIQDGAGDCLVRAKLRDETGRATTIAIQKSSELTRLRIGNESAPRLSQLARYCPVIVLEPGQHRLLEDGPNLRRRYLDWTVFHVEHAYLLAWQRHSRALRQRNALLRQRQLDQLPAWDREFVESAELMHELRQRVFDALLEPIGALLRQFLGEELELDIRYRRGWSSQRDLGELLQEQLPQDRERGFTQCGPQRAELRITAGGHLAREVLSRGQQKLLITALLLGQAEHFQQTMGATPILLVDDLPSELAAAARDRLFQWLQAYPGQSVLTTLELPLVPSALRQSASMFHVEHGGIRSRASAGEQML